MKKFAFSLVEIVITLAIVIVVFYISLPSLNFINRFILQNEANKLFSVFSFLQYRAIASNKEQKLFFDLKNKCCSYNKSKRKKILYKVPNCIEFGFLKNTKGPPSSPSKKIIFPITFKKNKKGNYFVTFFPNGKVSPGTIYLVDKEKRFMVAVTCPISKISFIRKYRYDNGQWICLK
ncbi:hypothetical protein KAT08_00495 [Candidatus Babeliales bacterium]|nr:hypothetical protein [Candidatus Babeliales bacterium]